MKWMHYGSVPGRAKPRLASLVVISRSLLRVAASLTCCPASDCGLSISDIFPPSAGYLAGPSTYRSTFRRSLSERDSCYLFPSLLRRWHSLSGYVCRNPTSGMAYCTVSSFDGKTSCLCTSTQVRQSYLLTEGLVEHSTRPPSNGADRIR